MIPKKIKIIFERLLIALIFCVITMVFFVGAQWLYDLGTDTYQVQRMLVDQKGNIKRVLFSPDNDLQSVLINLINNEHEHISIATFSFTNSSLAQALINAKKRGVRIEILADGGNAITSYSKISFLSENKIPVWIYPSRPYKNDQQKGDINDRNKTQEQMEACLCNATNDMRVAVSGIMHDKFMIFKRSLMGHMILWTGSYNFTRSANDRNQENAIVTDDPDIIKYYV